MLYTLLKLPQNCSYDCYIDASHKINKYLGNKLCTKSIYLMGNILVPGISDLDILVVIKDNEKIPQLDITGILNEQEKYTLMHGVFVVPESFWQYRHFFYIYDNLKLLGGDEMTEPPINPTQEFHALLLKRFATQHILKVYISLCAQLSVYSLKVRPLLCELHALRYDAKALSDWLSTTLQTEFQQYCQNIMQLRNDWFSLPTRQTQKQLLTICRELPVFLQQILHHINIHLVSNQLSHQKLHYNILNLSYHRKIYAGELREINGHNPSKLCWLGLLPMSSEKWRIKMHNRLSAYQLEIPLPLFAFISREFTHSLYSDFRKEIQTRQEILDIPVIQEIRKKEYALPVLDFLQ